MPHSKSHMAHGPFIVPTDNSPMPGKSELKIHKVGQPHPFPSVLSSSLLPIHPYSTPLIIP